MEPDPFADAPGDTQVDAAESGPDAPGDVHDAAAGSLWSVDFDGTKLGNVGALAATLGGYLSLARASVATVQTSATTVDTTPGVDQARVGSLGQGWQGLVVEETRTNLLWVSRSPGASHWVPDDIPSAHGPAAGPDGTVGAPEVVCNGADIGAFQSFHPALTPPWTASGWFQTLAPQAALQWGVNDDTGGVTDPSFFASVSTQGTGAWQRSVVPSTPGLSVLNFQTVDGRKRGAGTKDTPVDVYADLLQLEQGLFATEAIPTPAGPESRAGEHLWITNPSSALDAGQLSLSMLTRPKGGSGQYVAADSYLWYVDGSHYALLSATTSAVTVSFGAFQGTSLPLVFDAQAPIEWFFRVGGGTVKAQVRIANSAVTTLLDAQVPGAFPAGGIDLLSRGSANELSCWLEKVVVFHAGAAPAGF